MRQRRAHVPRDERHCRITERLWFILLWLEMLGAGWWVSRWPAPGVGPVSWTLCWVTHTVSAHAGVSPFPQEGPKAPFTEKNSGSGRARFSGCPSGRQAASLWLSCPRHHSLPWLHVRHLCPLGAPPMAPLLSPSQSFPKSCFF